MTLININNVEEYIYLLFDIYLLQYFWSSGFNKLCSGKLLELFAATLTCNKFFYLYVHFGLYKESDAREYVHNLLKVRD